MKSEVKEFKARHDEIKQTMTVNESWVQTKDKIAQLVETCVPPNQARTKDYLSWMSQEIT